ncbi:unnamed protein product [Rotaria socialis]|uniref:Serine aminopeptidase S33 domain-containing protein n=1 Tax=Rotaria socialis TaxID=392032 RepID=A0A820SUM9_9BILA|nr:unnamed protein product [Rotaria socialis]CAF4457256.1 unnamed protein product [Rotaria socialis]
MTQNGETFKFFSSFDHHPLTGRIWPTKAGPLRAVLLIVHGYGEHCQRYRHMADFFTNYQITCISYDMRGHGESQGERGFTPHVNALFDDLESVIVYIRQELYLFVPIIIYAHGTGSVLCASHCIRRSSQPLDCQAMILSTPSICVKQSFSKFVIFVARAFANLSPHLRLPVEGNHTAQYSNDPEVVEAYRNDPLVHDRWPASTCAMFIELGALLRKENINLFCPVLVQHGDADIITQIRYVEIWASEQLIGNVNFKRWPGHFHEIHNDCGKEEVFRFLLEWMTQNVFQIYYV